MPRKLTLILPALALALVVGVSSALAATVRAGDEPGVTDKTVLLGGTAPLTGLMTAYAPIARGADAYFRYVNARGGVNGRSIAYHVLDDGYNPAQTGPLTRQLVEQEKVFAVFNGVGTETSLAVRPYLNAAKVPQLFVASGGTTFGREYAQFPYTIGFRPSYQAEGWIYGKYLARTAPGARIAVLVQDDDYGKDLLGGLKLGLQRSRSKVIAAQPYAAATTVDLTPQITKLKSSDADTFAVLATPAFAIQALTLANKLGWRPRHVIVSSVASGAATMTAASDGGKNKLVQGAISIAYLKDPNDPQWAKDAGIRLYRQIMARYLPGASDDDPMYVYGMAVGWTAVEAIRKAGKELTREKLVKALDAFTATGNPFLLPGIAVKTAGRDHYPLEQMLLQRWASSGWRSFGGLWAYRRT